jgi:hypothetical protein
MCRAHHGLRQDHQWMVFQAESGTFRLDDPSSRTYIREPGAA